MHRCEAIPIDRRAQVRALAIALLIAGTLGCRWGGPAEAASAAAPSAFDAAADQSQTSVDRPKESPDAPTPDAPAPDGLNDLGRARDGAMDGPRADGLPADAATSPPDEGCQASFVSAVCDPVCNTGCPVLSRCDVSKTPRTGACVGIWIGGEGDICLRGRTTDSCAPRLTCLEGRCRRLCHRDADCATAGTCCSRSIDLDGTPSGFKACGPCPPP